MSAASPPRVSVVVPFLNPGPFFEEALESVFNQTYEDWELLLVDDGSTDGSTELARAHATDDSTRIRYLDHPGQATCGPSASRNRGIEASRGAYVAFLDHDDVWLPHKLEEQLPLMDSHPTAGMLYGVSERWFSWSGRPEDRTKDFIRPLPFAADRLFEPPSLLLFFLRSQGLPCSPTSVVARREALDAIGGFEVVPVEFQVYEDQFFWAKMALHYPVYASTACWDRYRKHPDQASALASAETHRLARQNFLEFVERYLFEHRVDDQDISDLLNRELHPVAAHGPTIRAAAHLVTSVATRACHAPAVVRRKLRGILAPSPTQPVLRRLRRARGETLIRIPTQSLIDDYGFSLADDGWHYFRSLVAEYEQRPNVALYDTTFFLFFRHDQLRAARYLDDVLFLHSPEDRTQSGFRFYFGTYPWGDWTLEDALVGGKPFGHYFDLVEGQDTRDLYGYRNNIWYLDGDINPLEYEWHHTLWLYESLKKGYRPASYRTHPSVVLLRRKDGELRAVRYDGQHRLSLLSHFGYEDLVVSIRPESIRLVDDREVENWYYVRKGLCSPERAQRIFNAFFELNGNERLAFLGLSRNY